MEGKSIPEKSRQEQAGEGFQGQQHITMKCSFPRYLSRAGWLGGELWLGSEELLGGCGLVRIGASLRLGLLWDAPHGSFTGVRT